MKLSALLADVKEYEIIDEKGALDLDTAGIEISDLIYDSRKVISDSAFFCITGARSDGNSYVSSAIKSGASVIISEKDIEGIKAADPEYESCEKKVPVIRVKDAKKALALMSAAYFDYPAKKLVTIGITGTKGKTTTTYMVYSALMHAGVKTGLIGTINTIIGDTVIKSNNTTPISYLVEKYFADMVKAGLKCVVMEVSSQAFLLDRVYGINFDIGVFTNISPDHIGPGEHDSFEDCMRCKGMLFQKCNMGIVNGDEELLDKVLEGHTCKLESYGIDPKNDIYASDIKLNTEDATLSVNYKLSEKKQVGSIPFDFDVTVDIPGRFSVYNSLCAVAIIRHLEELSISELAEENKEKYSVLKGITKDDIKASLKKVSVPGRIQMVPVSKKFSVMVDYAHNAVSLETLLTTLKEYNPKRLVCVFGCGGNRAKDRRYGMGEVSSKYADLTIVTSDNPRFEKPSEIIDDIIVGIKRANGRYVTIEDREDAIYYSLEHARPGDLIVVAGKGHEDYQEIKGVKHHMDDVEIIKAAAEKLDKQGRLL
jgi:UDP-N-acetylmuramoyl-L-alanyl-D-glutamate--2,6-diaminopimelate ligase